MDIQNYLSDRKNFVSSIGKICGEKNIDNLAVIHDNSHELFRDIETAIIVQAAESCRYSSEEFKIFKTGLTAMRQLMKEASAESKLKAKQEEEAKKTKTHKPTY